MKNIYKALAKFQAEVPAIHKATKGFNYTYADLTTIFKVIKPLLKKHDLGFTQLLQGDSLETIIFHVASGESLHSSVKIPQGVQLNKMNTFQVMGSAITYLRRYAISSALSLITDADLDACGEEIKIEVPAPQKIAMAQLTPSELQMEIAEGVGACKTLEELTAYHKEVASKVKKYPALKNIFTTKKNVIEVMQIDLFIDYDDYSEQKVLIGLSGGINSMAVLCWLAQYPEECKPKELHLYYAHFEEHSPDTLDFVLAGVEYAKKNFSKVIFYKTDNSIIEFFDKSNMIPHPMVSPCTRVLKIAPIHKYMEENNIEVDLVGYVRDEKRRILNMAKKLGTSPTKVVTKEGVEKKFIISDKSNEWCFQMVEKNIGWHPRIYDIKNRKGKRVFKHNNCLPCKNMNKKDFLNVKKYYPEYYKKAKELSEKLENHWGRKMGDFGEGDGSDCIVCSFD